jgi:prepilin-type N-terminal cleavage/methylation domain-containing protein
LRTLRSRRLPTLLQRRIVRRLGSHRDITRVDLDDGGFTLVELLIVVTVIPVIVGAISMGMVSVFSLQSGVASRLSHTADAQVVAANFAKDVQGAADVTTQSNSTPQCGAGTGTLLLGLISDQDLKTRVFQTDISYVSVPVVGTTTSYSLIRLFCTGGSSTPQSQTTLAYDVQSTQTPPSISCVAGKNNSGCGVAGQQWISTQGISQVTFAVNDAKGNLPYTLMASPVASTSSANLGSPLTTNTTTSCGFASPGTGTYASTMCFVDFSPLNGSALLSAQSGGCLEMSVALPGNFTMYFCLNLSGGQVLPWYLPTWPQAFLGNSINAVPFYTGIPGDPALYQRVQGSAPSVVTFSNISVVSPTGALATGWEVVSADAESSDQGESITWTSDAVLTVIPNGESGQTQPVGNACQNGTALVGSGTTTVSCSGGTTETSGTKTGTAMVWAAAPTTLQVTMVGVGLEAMAFGMLLP